MKRRFLPAVLPLVLCALPSSAFAQLQSLVHRLLVRPRRARVGPRSRQHRDEPPIFLPGAPAKLIVATTTGDVHLLDPDAGGTSVWLSPFNAGDGAVKGFVFPRFGMPNYIISTQQRDIDPRQRTGDHTDALLAGSCDQRFDPLVRF